MAIRFWPCDETVVAIVFFGWKTVAWTLLSKKANFWAPRDKKLIFGALCGIFFVPQGSNIRFFAPQSQKNNFCVPQGQTIRVFCHAGFNKKRWWERWGWVCAGEEVRKGSKRKNLSRAGDSLGLASHICVKMSTQRLHKSIQK